MKCPAIFFLLPLSSLLLFSCAGRDARTSFTLIAEIRGLGDDTILVSDVMSYRDTTYKIVHDGGRFKFVSRPDTFALYKFVLNGGSASFYAFAGKGGKADASGRVDSAILVTGNIGENARLMDFENRLRLKAAELSAGVVSTPGELEMALDSLSAAAASEYIRANPDDFVSVVVFEKYLWDVVQPDYPLMDSLLARMSGILLDLPEMQNAKNIVEKKKQSFNGRSVYINNIELTDGSKPEMKELRDNYLFLEFWASWSQQSLEYRSRLKEIYEKYRDAKKTMRNGEPVSLNFIGVSLDSDADLCDSLAAEHETAWPQLCDGKGWASDLVDKFAVTSLPDNVLLGTNNRVLGRGLSVEELDSILSKEFKR